MNVVKVMSHAVLLLLALSMGCGGTSSGTTGGPLRITTPTSISVKPDAQGNFMYSFQAAGGTPPYIWRIDHTPTGTSFSSDGVLTGYNVLGSGTYLMVTVDDTASLEATEGVEITWSPGSS